eukprot:COSAG05_NODE_3939_length_1764_cov_1.507508_1_plen_188_part_00
MSRFAGVCSRYGEQITTACNLVDSIFHLLVVLSSHSKPARGKLHRKYLCGFELNLSLVRWLRNGAGLDINNCVALLCNTLSTVRSQPSDRCCSISATSWLVALDRILSHPLPREFQREKQRFVLILFHSAPLRYTVIVRIELLTQNQTYRMVHCGAWSVTSFPLFVSSTTLSRPLSTLQPLPITIRP